MLGSEAEAQQRDRPTLSPNITLIDRFRDRVDLPAPTPPGVISIGREKQLFVDDWLIERRTGSRRTFHPVRKHPANPLLTPERAWERPSVLLSGSVMYDPNRAQDRFRMWYLCYTPVEDPVTGESIRKDGRICYATSVDGLRWERPALGLHPYGSSRSTNIVIPAANGFPGVVLDPRDADPGRRYKAHARTNRGHDAFFSHDGVHWSEPHRMDLDGYDRSSVHWDPVRELWAASTKSWYRTAPEALEWRGRGYQESRDFLHWPRKAAYMAGTTEEGPEIVYALDAFYYESLYLGAWGRYVAEPNAHLDPQLAISRNGRHWTRPTEAPWIPLSPLPADYRRKPGPRTPTGVDPLDPRVPWDYGNTNINSLGPLRVGDELWIYYSGRSSDHRSRPQTGAIGLGTMRLDGFASLDAGREEVEVVTRPVRLTGPDIRVNADAGEGELLMEITDLAGRALPQFSFDRCRPVRSDGVRQTLSWRGNPELSIVGDQPVRLRVRLRSAKWYAVWCGEERRWSSPDTETWSAAARR